MMIPDRILFSCLKLSVPDFRENRVAVDLQMASTIKKIQEQSKQMAHSAQTTFEFRRNRR